jgi:predicted secreted hydrolase
MIRWDLNDVIITDLFLFNCQVKNGKKLIFNNFKNNDISKFKSLLYIFKNNRYSKSTTNQPISLHSSRLLAEINGRNYAALRLQVTRAAAEFR